MTTPLAPALHRSGRFQRFPWVAAACLLLSGCSYMETVMNRNGQPDQRVQLGMESGTVFLRRQEIPNYVCTEPWLLKCDRSGTIYACGCTRRRL